VLVVPLGVAAKQNVHYIVIFSLFFFVPHTFLPDGVIVGFRKFEEEKNKIWGKTKSVPPQPPGGAFF
jgi:hypothetical protein